LEVDKKPLIYYACHQKAQPRSGVEYDLTGKAWPRQGVQAAHKGEITHFLGK
jgi:hypothetical protein